MTQASYKPEKSGKVIDYLETEIEPGDLLVYPVRRGSDLYMQQATVEGIEWDGLRPYVVAYKPTGRRVQIHNLDNTITMGKREG